MSNAPKTIASEMTDEEMGNWLMEMALAADTLKYDSPFNIAATRLREVGDELRNVLKTLSRNATYLETVQTSRQEDRTTAFLEDLPLLYEIQKVAQHCLESIEQYHEPMTRSLERHRALFSEALAQKFSEPAKEGFGSDQKPSVGHLHKTYE